MQPEGQGTIEYLILVGIIVVLSLAVVSIVFLLTENNDSIDSSRKISNLTSAIPITDAALSTQGDALIVLKNNTGEVIEITNLKLEGEGNDYDLVRIAQGQEVVYFLNDFNICSCENEEENEICEITISYNSNGISKQNYSTIILDCTSTITPKENVQQPKSTSDTTPPMISLFSPEKDYTVVNGDNNIHFIFSANETTTDCNLYIDSILVDRNYSTVLFDNNITLDGNLALFSEGDHNWNITCSDALANIGTSEDRNINYTQEIIIIVPTIQLSVPSSGTIDLDGVSDFNFTITDAQSVQACYLIMNGNITNTLLSTREGANSFSAINFSPYGSDTNITWDVNCATIDNNYGAGSNYNIYYASLYLTSDGTGLFANDENISLNFSNYTDLNTYWYKWYKNNDLNATTLIPSGLVAYYPFNNDLNDHFGSNNNITVYGAMDNNTTFGKIGKGYYFDGGTQDCLKINSPNFLTNQSGTIAFWIKPSVLDYDSFFTIRGPSKYITMGIGTSWRIAITENFTDIYGFMTTLQTLNNTLVQNTWRHVVITSNATDVDVYINGSRTVASSQYLSPASPNNGQWFGDVASASYALIGCANPSDSSTQNRINAAIDELMIFDRAITGTEARQLYNAGIIDGNKLSATLTEVGNVWKAGYQTNYDRNFWATDKNSLPKTIT
jgi:hypothetical protein